MSRIKSLTTKLIVSGLILFAVYECSNRFYFNEVEADISSKHARLEELKRENDHLEELKAKSGILAANVNEAEKSLASLQVLLPGKDELPAVFDWLSKRALENRVKLDRFNQAGATLESKQQTQTHIKEIPLRVEVLGSYEAIQYFLLDFSRYERMLLVREVHMKQEQQVTPSATVRATINFSAFGSK